jgi:indolepyruvate ferredoxin oxidoreductase beta subunit
MKVIMTTPCKNILICGVGGQGILLASELTSSALLQSGYDVKQSEVHGMAQRGGSVVAHLRFGKKVYSPLIEPGTADIAVAFEMMEAVRYLPYLNNKSSVILNTQKISPPSVATGQESYPDTILDTFRRHAIHVSAIDAFSIAQGLGETRAVNMVLVGALSTLLPVPEKTFIKVMEERIPPKILAVNRAAFMKGRAANEPAREVRKQS